MAEGTVVVDARGPRRLAHLDMACDAKEIPTELAGEPLVSWWIVAECTFTGTAHVGGETIALGDPSAFNVRCPAAVAFAAGRFCGIAGGADMSKPALWWSWLLADVATETAGEAGSFKKRPAAVILNLGGGGQTGGQTLVLQGISRLHRQMNRHQTGQELAFREELRAASAVPPHQRQSGPTTAAPLVPPSPPAGPPGQPSPLADGLTRTWVRDPALGDLFVLHVDGVRQATTSVVDRSAPRAEQMAALAAATWIPPQQFNALYERIAQDRLPPPWEGRLAGRHVTPLLFGGSAAVIDSHEPASAHPVRQYLFPDTDEQGRLALDHDEVVIATWPSRAPAFLLREDGQGEVRSGSYTKPPQELRNLTCTLTSKRLIASGPLHIPTARRSDYPSIFLPTAAFEAVAAFRQIKRWATSPDLVWAWHLRHEWVSEVGHGGTPDRKKPIGGHEWHSDFIVAGHRFPIGNTGLCQLPYRQASPTRAEVAQMYASAVEAAGDAVRADAAVALSRPVPSVGFSSRMDREDSWVQTVHGTQPWSLPVRF